MANGNATVLWMTQVRVHSHVGMGCRGSAKCDADAKRLASTARYASTKR